MDLSRRTFFGFTTLAFTGTSTSEVRRDEPLAIDADAGELVFVGATRDPVRVKLGTGTTGTFGMITQQMAPGSSIPVHLHQKEDELSSSRAGRAPRGSAMYAYHWAPGQHSLFRVAHGTPVRTPARRS